MNEFTIAQDLIESYNNLKKQNHNTSGLGANIERPEYENCDFELLKKFLYNKGFKSQFQKIDKHEFLIITPLT